NHRLALVAPLCNPGRKVLFQGEAGAEIVGKVVGKPEACIVPCGFILGTGIAQPDDQADGKCSAHESSYRKKKTPAEQPPGRGRKRPDSIGQGSVRGRTRPAPGKRRITRRLLRLRLARMLQRRRHEPGHWPPRYRRPEPRSRPRAA